MKNLSEIGKNNRSTKSNIIISFIIIVMFACIYGYMEHLPNHIYAVVNLYSIDKDKNTINSNIEKYTVKEMNLSNSGFAKQYSNKDIRLDITPNIGGRNIYDFNVYTNSRFTSQDFVALMKEYQQYMSSNNRTIDIYDTSHFEDASVTNFRLKDMLMKAMASIIYLLVAWLFLGEYKETIQKSKTNTLIFTLVGVLAILARLQAILCAVAISAYIVKGFIAKYHKDKYVLKIFSIAFCLRIVTAIFGTIINLYKYGSLLSYFQSDELMYYSTASRIANVLANFKRPDFTAIAGVDQYGYNVFLALLKVLNGEFLFTSKVINALVSSIFVILVYDLVVRLYKDGLCAKITGIFMCFMPTMIIFSSFTLRDLFIAVLIFGIFNCFISISRNEGRIKSNILKLIIYCGFLWYLRRYALIIVLGVCAIYLALEYLDKKRINKLYVIILFAILGAALITIVTKIYSVDIVNMTIDYVGRQGVIKYVAGLLMSLLNLDFITNMSGTTYGSGIIFRFLYPETIILVLTLPWFFIGVVKSFKEKFNFTLCVLMMFVGFITIYKIQYNGWFLRTQLQIFAFQYIFISVGFSEFVKNSSQKVKLFSKNALSRLQ